MKLSKALSFFIILIIYTVAFFTGIILNGVFRQKGLLIAVFLADAAATIVVWIFGVILKNFSVYDPYWSVAPILIVSYWVLAKESPVKIADYMLLFVVFVWGARLTINWAVNWNGMDHEDWRYGMYRKKSGRLWQIVNLGGINMMPTVLVYLGLIPAYHIIFNQLSFNIAFYAGFAIALISPIIQWVSDSQMKAHRMQNTGTNIETGLWKYSRHPNYFGEVIFWWGIFIMQLGVTQQFWVSFIGALLITLLFLFISIPMMEKHVSGRLQGYEDYQSRVSVLIPWFRNT